MNRHFFQRRYRNNPRVQEKMLNIISQYGKANQNYNEKLQYALRWLLMKKMDKKCWGGYGEFRTLTYCWWNAKSPLQKTV